MYGFPVYSYGQRTISLWFNNSIQEGDGAILLIVLYCKPYGRVNTVYVLKETLFIGFLVDDKGVIYIPALINSILYNVTKETEECRTKLAAIISTQRLRECRGFVDKVSEIRFTKVRQRQLNKFNILINKKEGNITRANAINLTNNLTSQAGRQASISLPSRESSNPSQTGRQAGTLLPSGEGSNQAGSQAGTSQATAHLHSGEGSSSSPASSQAGALLPAREGSSSSQAIAHLPFGEGSSSPPAGNQAIKLGQSGKVLGGLTGIGHPRLPRRTALSPRKTTSPLPPQ